MNKDKLLLKVSDCKSFEIKPEAYQELLNKVDRAEESEKETALILQNLENDLTRFIPHTHYHARSFYNGETIISTSIHNDNWLTTNEAIIELVGQVNSKETKIQELNKELREAKDQTELVKENRRDWKKSISLLSYRGFRKLQAKIREEL